MIVKIWPIKAVYSGEKGKVGGWQGVKNALHRRIAQGLVVPGHAQHYNLLMLHLFYPDARPQRRGCA